MGLPSELIARLQQRSATWAPEPGATPDEIAALRGRFPFLPQDYLSLLEACDGGEGELALPPRWLQLWSARGASEMSEHAQDLWPGLFAFASSGGIETIAIDRRRPEPWPIVMLDAIAGVESIEVIATDWPGFGSAIGHAYAGGGPAVQDG